jgi:putative ABC transport system permease protein
MTGARQRGVCVVERLLRWILYAYPARFRDRFEREVIASAREDLDGAATRMAFAAVALRELGQAAAGVIPQHQLERVRHGRAGFRETVMFHWQSILSDARFAVRSLAKAPGFTTVALLVLALGIGASTAIFSVVDAVVLRALPFDEHDRLVAVLEHDPARSTTFGSGATTAQNYLDWRSRLHSYQGMAIVGSARFRLQNEAGEPADAPARSVTPEFFDVLRVRPLLGRAFVAEDETASRQVVMLSYPFWQRQFGGAPDVVGRTIDLNEKRWEIVGVLPQSFSYPVSSPQPAELFVPVHFTAADKTREHGNRTYNYLAIARLESGVSIAAANGEIVQLAKALAAEHPKWYDDRTGRVIPLQEQFVAPDVRRWMLMLLGAVTFVLLIACANVANLMLARATSQSRELGIRAALGAGRVRLMRGVLIESLVLSLAGTMLGVIVGAGGVRVLKAWLPAGIPRVAAIAIDWRVLLVAAGAAIVTGLMFGLLPAWHSSRPNISQGLRDGGRSATAGAAKQRTRSALVVAEMALATLLVVGAGLFIASFVNLLRVDAGFDYRGVITPGSVGVAFDQNDLAGTFARGRQYTREMVAAIARAPGVDEVAGVQGGLPFSGSWSRTLVTLPERGELKGDDDQLDIRRVTLGYLELLRVPLRAGRLMNGTDVDGAPPVIVLNEAAAKRYWPGEPPIGQRLTINKIEHTVIGVVGDIRHLGPETPSRPEGYAPTEQSSVTSLTLVVRARGDAASVLPGIRSAIWSVNPEQRLRPDVLSMEGYFDRLIAQRRFSMAVLALFGVLGLVIAAAGIYGVMAYLVSQRTSEFGVRMALGATRTTLVRMVIGQAGRLIVIGLAIGGAIAWWFSGAVSAFLFQLDGGDLRVLTGAVIVLATTGILASALPARRAARVDPLTALRAD